MTGTHLADTLNGDAGDNVISGLAGGDTISGGDGNDTLYGYSAGASGAIASTIVASGIAAPVAGAATDADPGFLYIMEKNTGIIWRVNEDTGARTAFLDIPENEFTDDGERGALGLAFHPDYATNGRFFVFLTDAQGDLQVREYARSADPAVAQTSFTIIWETPHPGENNHNGGWIGFSPTDGYLYISTGDGGGGNDPNNNAQNLNSLLGKILRIDVDNDAFPANPNLNYANPAGNPFVGINGADEIWACGLRNPWRAAFDPRNGDFYIGDVGQQQLEEIDFIANGEGGVNFGWRIMEGSLPHLPGPPGSPPAGHPSLRLPVYEYARNIGTTITGGEVYVGPMASFVGSYVFADFGSDRVFSLRMIDGVFVDGADRTAQLTGALPDAVVDFVTGTDGTLYAIGIGGTVWRLDPQLGAEDVGDVLNGGAGNDVIDGGVGADQMTGGPGDDVFVVDNDADATIEAANEGTDTVLSSRDWILRANVENLTLQGAALEGAGNGLNNIIVGTAAANTLYGVDGDDTLRGGGGADAMLGGAGADTADYSTSPSRVVVRLWEGVIAQGDAQGDTLTEIENLTGSNHDDDLAGNTLANTLRGNDGADVLDGREGDDVLVGGAGGDTMAGGAGIDTVSYANAAARVVVRLWNQTAVEGEAQGDSLSGFENAIGGAAKDALIGDGHANQLDGGGQDDYLDGLAGDDTLRGGFGADRLVGGEGADALDGGDGIDLADYAAATSRVVVRLWNGTGQEGVAQGDTLIGVENITGSSANDALIGDAFSNVLRGAAGADYLDGLEGDDVLVGGIGADIMVGGTGIDTVSYEDASARVVIRLSNQTAVEGEAQGDVISGFENATGGAGNDALIGDANANRLDARAGNDYLDGGAGNDILVGGLGDDRLVGGAGADQMNGGDGVDLADYSSATTRVVVRLSTGLGESNHAQGDTLSNIENLTGGSANDSLIGANNVANALRGGGGDDYLDGLSGNDYLDGGAGVDRMNGGAGADTFAFVAGQGNGDQVFDFVSGQDTMRFEGYGAGATLTQVDATHWRVASADELIADIITLTNAASIAPGDVLFV